MIEDAQVVIGEELAGQVPQRQPAAPRRGVRVDDGLQQFEYDPILEPPAEQTFQDLVVDGIELLAHVELQIPLARASKACCTQDRPVQALAFAAGVAVPNDRTSAFPRLPFEAFQKASRRLSASAIRSIRLPVRFICLPAHLQDGRDEPFAEFLCLGVTEPVDLLQVGHGPAMAPGHFRQLFIGANGIDGDRLLGSSLLAKATNTKTLCGRLASCAARHLLLYERQFSRIAATGNWSGSGRRRKRPSCWNSSSRPGRSSR